MQLLEQMAYDNEFVQEVMFPKAKEKKIWFGEKCKDGRTAVKEANTLYKSGAYKQAKEKYIYAKGIFTDLKKEFSKLGEDGGGIVNDVIHGAVVAGTAAIPGVNFGTLIYLVWQLCRDFTITTDVGKMLKLRENDVEILKDKKDYNVDEPTYVKYMLDTTDDIIYYCDQMAKKCSRQK